MPGLKQKVTVARYQEKLAQLEELRRAMKAGSNRMKGEAVARLFSRIVVCFDQTRKHGGWLPDETEFHLWPAGRDAAYVRPQQEVKSRGRG